MDDFKNNRTLQVIVLLIALGIIFTLALYFAIAADGPAYSDDPGAGCTATGQDRTNLEDC